MKDNFRLLTCMAAFLLSVFSLSAAPADTITIWEGDFWADNDWTHAAHTVSLPAVTNWDDYKTLRFHNDNRSVSNGYLVFLFKGTPYDNPDNIIAKTEPGHDDEYPEFTRYATYADLELTERVLNKLKATNELHMQLLKIDVPGDGFNWQKIELIPKTPIPSTILWSGEHHAQKWGDILKLDASKFSTAIPGNKLLLSLKDVKDDIELKANNVRLPGTQVSHIPGSSSYVVYMTEDMIRMCQLYGMEICGPEFTITEIKLSEGKAGQLKAGRTIWTGYQWADTEWKRNLQLFEEALTAVGSLDNYQYIRFYNECATTHYCLGLYQDCYTDSENKRIAQTEEKYDYSTNPFQRKDGYAELELTDEVKAKLGELYEDMLYVCTIITDGGSAFNLTDIVLIPKYATIDEAANSTSEWAEFDGQTMDAHLVRTLVPGMYNTLCLPFNLNATQIASSDLADSKICALDKTTLDGDEVTLYFKETTEIVAGKPYIIQPAQQVENPVFNDVVINAAAPSTTEKDDVIFHGIYTQTHLDAGNKNLLFLGADNTLYFPYAGGNESMKGLRGYFEITQPAHVIRRAAFRIGENSVVTSLEHVGEKATVKKIMMKNNIVIRTNGTEYFINGARK